MLERVPLLEKELTDYEDVGGSDGIHRNVELA